MKKKLLFIAAAAVFAIVPFAHAQEEAVEVPPLTEEEMSIYDYNADAPLEITEDSSEMRGEITVSEITFARPNGEDGIHASLVTPPGEGPFAGVLWVHWYEPGNPTSNRSEFLDEAVMLAEEGVVSLLVDTMWSEPTWYRERRSLDSDYQDAVQQVIELRRGLDVLLAQPNVDPARIAFVGHDFGGMYGAPLAAVDRRPVAYVIIAAASNFNNWMLFGVPEDQAGLAEYMAQMDTIAPTRYVAEAAPAPVLYQFGSEDFYTPADDVFAFINATSEPKKAIIYQTEHAMALDVIREDRLEFLREQLGLSA